MALEISYDPHAKGSEKAPLLCDTGAKREWMISVESRSKYQKAMRQEKVKQFLRKGMKARVA